jgi:hypothetical protein
VGHHSCRGHPECASARWCRPRSRIRHRWRPDQHRLERVDRRGQHLVLDLDEVERFLGDRQLVRGHRGHGWPTKTTRSMASTAWRASGLFLELRDVGRGEHGADAREGLGLARVDADDLGVGMRARRSFACSMPRGLMSATYGRDP